jgi:hypothetical protein
VLALALDRQDTVTHTDRQWLVTACVRDRHCKLSKGMRSSALTSSGLLTPDVGKACVPAQPMHRHRHALYKQLAPDHSEHKRQLRADAVGPSGCCMAKPSLDFPASDTWIRAHTGTGVGMVGGTGACLWPSVSDSPDQQISHPPYDCGGLDVSTCTCNELANLLSCTNCIRAGVQLSCIWGGSR